MIYGDRNRNSDSDRISEWIKESTLLSIAKAMPSIDGPRDLMTFEYLSEVRKLCHLVGHKSNIFLPGLEPGIFGSVDRRLIRWATGT